MYEGLFLDKRQFFLEIVVSTRTDWNRIYMDHIFIVCSALISIYAPAALKRSF
jgi:hypothetical protein